jgi:hypothetical protein
MIGQDCVKLDQVDGLRICNIKRGLYWGTSDIGKAPVKSHMKNIFEGEFDRLLRREIGEAIKGRARDPFLVREIDEDLVDHGFIDDSERLPNAKVPIVIKPNIPRKLRVHAKV